ncbi:MAG: flagellar motor switch protein FliG [Spirochaetota bacterium]
MAKSNSSDSSNQGARKAATLLLTMGKEEAAKVLSHMDERMIEAIILEMSKIKAVKREEKENILKEFKDTMDVLAPGLQGGMETARDLLSNSIGQEKAENILHKVGKKDIKKDFEFLNDIDPQTIASMVMNEAPQTIAVTLSYMNPRKSAEVMKSLSSELQTEVALKLATTSKTHPEAIIQIAKGIRRKYESRDQSEFTNAGGTESLANILNHIDKNVEDKILRQLSERSPELAEQVREKLYIFEDILNLSLREMRIVISQLGGDDLLVIALRGAGDDIRQHFFNAMSQNRASDIIEEMDARGKTTLREINMCRAEILNIARELEEKGQIIIKKEKEEYI